MTEAQWLACDEAEPMLRHLDGRVSDRKLRLFAIACCHRIWHLVPADALWVQSLAVAERYAEGGASPDELHHFYSEALSSAASNFGTQSEPTRAAVCVVLTALRPVLTDILPSSEGRWRFERPLGCGAAGAVLAQSMSDIQSTWWKRLKAMVVGFPYRRVWSAEQSQQADTLRDIFGNPFRPVTFSPEWRTITAVALANLMYQDRDFGAMPILADALQDAGCEVEEILNHCRDEKLPHVRGCWVVDLVLGKE